MKIIELNENNIIIAILFLKNFIKVIQNVLCMFMSIIYTILNFYLLRSLFENKIYFFFFHILLLGPFLFVAIKANLINS